MSEKIKAKDMTEFDGPVDTGNPHGKRPADKKQGDLQPDESVSKKGKKGSDLPGTTTIGEEVAAIFSEVEGLSEDFVTKASTLFEGAVSEKVATIREEVEAEFNSKLEEAYETLVEDFEVKLDEYLNYFCTKYLEENKVAIENGFRKELAEQVIESINSIVESAGVDLSDEKIDIADALVAENEQLEEKYNAVLSESMKLQKELRDYRIKEIFVESTAGLSEGTKDKLRRLTENLEFANEEQYAEKLEVLKESLSEGTTAAAETDILKESVLNEERVTNPKMSAYIQASRGLRL